MAVIKEAVRVLGCGHTLQTGMSMRMFRAVKGELTECRKGCGEQPTTKVVGIAMSDADFVKSVRRTFGFDKPTETEA